MLGRTDAIRFTFRRMQPKQIWASNAGLGAAQYVLWELDGSWQYSRSPAFKMAVRRSHFIMYILRLKGFANQFWYSRSFVLLPYDPCSNTLTMKFSTVRLLALAPSNPNSVVCSLNMCRDDATVPPIFFLLVLNESLRTLLRNSLLVPKYKKGRIAFGEKTVDVLE